jgi:hypothetical protein
MEDVNQSQNQCFIEVSWKDVDHQDEGCEMGKGQSGRLAAYSWAFGIRQDLPRVVHGRVSTQLLVQQSR